MEAYLRAFVNSEQNDWARLLPMAEIAYNNAKNASTGHTPFELNCGYHPRVSYEEDVDPRSKSKSAEELPTELRVLMTVCRETLHHAQELQKRADDKGVKPRSYALSKGQAKISSMNRLNCVSDLMSDLIENTGYAALSIYISLLQLPYILALVKHD